MDHNRSETVLPLDMQESQAEPVQPEQKRIIMDAVRKFSALAKYPTPRIDQTRKPFFALPKTPRVFLQPWPSATSLSRQGRQFADTPTIPDSEMNPWREHPLKTFYPPTLQISSSSTQAPETPESQDGVVNSGFPTEHAKDTHDCGSESRSDSLRSDVFQFQCQGNVCQAGPTPSETVATLSAEESVRPRLNSCPKYLVKRHRSVGESCRRKAIRWKQMMDNQMKLRRRTADNIPYPAQDVLSHARSSPNLRNAEENSQTATTEVPDPGTELSDVDEDVSKL